jgi:hypothetical protein
LEQLIKKNKKIINNENNKEKQKNPSEIEWQIYRWGLLTDKKSINNNNLFQLIETIFYDTNMTLYNDTILKALFLYFWGITRKA